MKEYLSSKTIQDRIIDIFSNPFSYNFIDSKKLPKNIIIFWQVIWKENL